MGGQPVGFAPHGSADTILDGRPHGGSSPLALSALLRAEPECHGSPKLPDSENLNGIFDVIYLGGQHRAGTGINNLPSH